MGLSFNVIAGHNIPESLFGVTLGKKIDPIYRGYSERINIKKITAENNNWPDIEYYFQPIDEAINGVFGLKFPYIEYKNDNSKDYLTSFYFSTLQVFPDNFDTNIDNFDTTTREANISKVTNEFVIKHIMTQGMIYEIGWKIEIGRKISGKNKSDSRYSWAEDLCKVFEERYRKKPEVFGGLKDCYICRFSFDKEREFTIVGFIDGRALVSLKYKNEILDKKRKESKKIFNNIKAKGILP